MYSAMPTASDLVSKPHENCRLSITHACCHLRTRYPESWWVRSLNSFLSPFLGSFFPNVNLESCRAEERHRGGESTIKNTAPARPFGFEVFHESTSVPFEVSQPADVTGWTSRLRRKVRGWTRPATCRRDRNKSELHHDCYGTWYLFP
jgi:hypothetical protein